ncbi:uncharacterized protein LOC112087982 [Eutrema salsugineum]|uniref:uncharacterized protein LOC112087982 n=1 Tax=Eutrema salsugineum TaxID=72664 RepID=UPI000CECF4F5|nr:uncharacterized protein LOC112087982 [Eutrema salsugineum]
MPPKKTTNNAVGDNQNTAADWTEFRTQLLAMQENMQATIHASIHEMGEMLMTRLDARMPAQAHVRDRGDNPFADRHDVDEVEEDEHHRRVRNRDNNDHGRDNKWEASFKVDIPEFHGGIRGDDLLDWIVSVKEVLDFKQVPDHRRVPLVVMRFRGHAASWWKQLKSTRTRTGREPIQSCEKLKKHLRKAFLPHNYNRMMFTRLQNLRQGSRSVEEYAEEFSVLLTRNELHDSESQLVSRFIGGLRPQLQSAMAQFDPTSISEALRRAVSFEQQLRSSTWASAANRNKAPDFTNGAPQAKDNGEIIGKSSRGTAQTEETTLRRSTRPNALRCYSCGEQGHRQKACPHQPRRGLIADDAIDDREPVYDSHDDGDSTVEDRVVRTQGDTSKMLVLHRTCITPRRQDMQWLRTNIFRSTCTIRGRVCSFIIDSGSCRNVIADAAVEKLGLPREDHPAPYTLGWLREGVSVRITQRSLVPFSIGPYYRDRMYCDIAPMDVSHLLLGRP